MVVSLAEFLKALFGAGIVPKPQDLVIAEKNKAQEGGLGRA
jgi:hypothetical protein